MALSTTKTQTKKTKPGSNNPQDESGELNSGADAAANRNSAQNPEEKKRQRKNNGGKYGFDDYPSAPTSEIKIDDYNKGDYCPIAKRVNCITVKPASSSNLMLTLP